MGIFKVDQKVLGFGYLLLMLITGHGKPERASERNNRGDGRCSRERIFFIGLKVCPNSEGF